MSAVLSTAGLFVLTALAEIVGCYLPYLWLRKGAQTRSLSPNAAGSANGHLAGGALPTSGAARTTEGAA